MNKHERILAEGKRLFGTYGYLGFTLKKLAVACDMTAPALYYFYSSKANLFRDCLLSEMEARKACAQDCAERATSLEEFATLFTVEAIAVCHTHNFIVGHAMDEVVHLPADMREELWAAWDRSVISPVVAFLDHMLPGGSSPISRRLMATAILNMAAFVAAKEEQFNTEELSTLFQAFVKGLELSTVAQVA